jgi:hypothetical protein
LAWRLLGKQFLVIAQRNAASTAEIAPPVAA